MSAKFSGKCNHCTEDINVGDQVEWYGKGEIYHFDCRPLGSEQESKKAWREFKQKGFLAIDLETGGKRPDIADAILSLGAIALTPNMVIKDWFYSLIKPPPHLNIFDEALAVNGITREQIENAPPELEVLANFIAWAKQYEEHRFMGYHCPFDLGGLDTAFRRCKLDARGLWLMPALDLCLVSREVLDGVTDPDGTVSYKQTNVARHLNIDAEGAHNAIVDIYLTTQIGRRIVVPHE